MTARYVNWHMVGVPGSKRRTRSLRQLRPSHWSHPEGSAPGRSPRTGGSLSLIVASFVLAAAAPVSAQVAPESPGTAAAMARLRVAEARSLTMPDTPGDGAFPAIKEELASLPGHVVYRPADLTRLAGRTLPIVVWGNGGCQADGAAQRFHLAEIASHGYLVIANGTIRSGPGITPPPRPPLPPGQLPPPATTATQLTQAIDWAIAENTRLGSPLRGRIATKEVAVSGWSCGGVQALSVATSDPRIRTTVIHNSGLFTDKPPVAGMDLPKSALARLRAPILYVLGGPSDIAYRNGMDDYARIDGPPAAVVNLRGAGHGGSFFELNGGLAARIAVAWLDWRLKGDAAAARLFEGAGCGLCHDQHVTLSRKHLE